MNLMDIFFVKYDLLRLIYSGWQRTMADFLVRMVTVLQMGKIKYYVRFNSNCYHIY